MTYLNIIIIEHIFQETETYFVCNFREASFVLLPSSLIILSLYFLKSIFLVHSNEKISCGSAKKAKNTTLAFLVSLVVIQILSGTHNACIKYKVTETCNFQISCDIHQAYPTYHMQHVYYSRTMNRRTLFSTLFVT